MLDLQRRFLVLVLLMPLLHYFVGAASAQAVPDLSTVVHGVDSSVRNRIDHLAGYTVTEHYAVFRGHDESKQVADMVVKTTYRKESGKSFTIVSQSGSSFWRSEVLDRLLDNEKRMSQPTNVESALINSSNYEMSLDQNSEQKLDGRDCVVLDIRLAAQANFCLRESCGSMRTTTRSSS